MKRFFVPLVVALACTSAAALAQVGPGGVGPGAGTQLGIQQLDQSGQVGFVTLFNAGAGTRIVTAINGAPAGRVQTVAIQRGKGCNAFEPQIVARSADLAHGISHGMVPIAEDALLSGNYDVIVYSNNGPGARPVACGHLHR
jgi:hypothetical protein